MLRRRLGRYHRQQIQINGHRNDHMRQKHDVGVLAHRNLRIHLDYLPLTCHVNVGFHDVSG